MRYKVVAEGHEGVYSVDEEYLMTIDAIDKQDAMQKFLKINKDAKYIDSWECVIIGARKINFVLEI